MGKRIKLAVIMVLYCLAGAVLSYMVSLEMSPVHQFGNKRRLVCALAFIVLLTAVTILGRRFFPARELRHAIMKTYVCGLALYYLFAIAGLFFFSYDFALHGGESLTREQYKLVCMRMLPFQSYREIILQAETGGQMFHDLLVMLGGRFLVYLPMGLFLLTLIRWFRPFQRYCITMLSIILGVELLQYVLCLGTVTFDGIALNCCGAAAAYYIYHQDWVQKLLVKFQFIYD